MEKIEMQCKCGKEGKYIHIKDGVEVLSCNKYTVCLSYEELLGKYHNTKTALYQLLEAAAGLITYKEGTAYYNQYEHSVRSIIKKMKGGEF